MMFSHSVNNSKLQVLLSHVMTCVKALCKYKACYRNQLLGHFKKHQGSEYC